jgi:hypothetical protein
MPNRYSTSKGVELFRLAPQGRLKTTVEDKTKKGFAPSQSGLWCSTDTQARIVHAPCRGMVLYHAGQLSFLPNFERQSGLPITC